MFPALYFGNGPGVRDEEDRAVPVYGFVEFFGFGAFPCLELVGVLVKPFACGVVEVHCALGCAGYRFVLREYLH